MSPMPKGPMMQMCIRDSDHLGAQPAQKQDAAIDGQLHHRGVEHQHPLGPDKQPVHILAGLFKFADLMVFPHIGL